MIKNIIFDFGAVLVDWNPEYLYAPYFKDAKKTEYFLTNVCPYEWNTTVDGGRSTEEATLERIALYPEWEKEIKMYFGEWIKMMRGEIPTMYSLVESLKNKGYGVYGLTNWSAETFPLIKNKYPVFSLLQGYVVSGEEHLLKPQAEIYLTLLKRYSLKAEECVFIDDNPKNTEGAEKVGIKGIVFTTPEKLKEELKAILQ